MGRRGLEYEYYRLAVLSPELVQQAIDLASEGFDPHEAASVALVLEILEEKTGQTFTNQTAFVLWDEPDAAGTLVSDAEFLFDDPSPDISYTRMRGKPVFQIVGIQLVVQRSLRTKM